MPYHNKNKNEKGITIYLAVLLLGATLTTALFVSRTLVKEFIITKGVADSMKAVYVADSATEFTLYQTRVLTGDVINLAAPFIEIIAGVHYSIPTGDCQVNLSAGNAGDIVCSIDTYTSVAQGTDNCPASADPNATCTRVVAKGAHGAINRALEIVYENL